MRKIRGIALLIVGCIFAAACGSSGSSPSSGAASPSSGSVAAKTGSTTSSSASGAYASGAGSSSASSAGGGIDVTTKHSKFGTILAAGSKHLTVYMYEADHRAASNCAGACAAAWPPVIANGAAMASGKATSSDLGTTMRAGGVKQVTYRGHPLYYFRKDKDHSDVYGQGSHAFGAGWYVLAPSGNKVDNS